MNMLHNDRYICITRTLCAKTDTHLNNIIKMQIAIKKADINKIDLDLINSQFGAYCIDKIEYNSSSLTKTLNEFVFEFDFSKKEELLKYLKENYITAHILN